MDKPIQLNNPVTGLPDPELNLVLAMPTWAKGFNPLRYRQNHVLAMPVQGGPAVVVFVQEVFQN